MSIKQGIPLFVAATFLPFAVNASNGTGGNMKIYAAAKAAVIAQLKDPDSARFGKLVRMMRPNVRGQPTDVVCGEVNARNSFGGYTGMTGFVYFVGDRSVHIADGGDVLGELGATIYYRFCGPAPSEGQEESAPDSPASTSPADSDDTPHQWFK